MADEKKIPQNRIVSQGPGFEDRFADILSTGLANLIGDKLSNVTGVPRAQQEFGGFGGNGGFGMESPKNFKDQLALANFQQRQNSLRQSALEKHRESRLKETKEQRKSYEAAANAAKENLVNIDVMEKLIKDGNVAGPLRNKLMKSLHLEGYRSDDTQLFEKLSTDFLRNAKAIFGPRLTQGEVNRYLQTVPTLAQSDGAKLKVMRFMRRFNQAAILRNEAKNEIIRANGGIPPYNLEEQIEEFIGPELDSLKQELIDSFGGGTFNELPNPAQNRGRKIQDDETGEILISDGTRWVKGR